MSKISRVPICEGSKRKYLLTCLTDMYELEHLYPTPTISRGDTVYSYCKWSEIQEEGKDEYLPLWNENNTIQKLKALLAVSHPTMNSLVSELSLQKPQTYCPHHSLLIDYKRHLLPLGILPQKAEKRLRKGHQASGVLFLVPRMNPLHRSKLQQTKLSPATESPAGNPPQNWATFE